VAEITAEVSPPPPMILSSRCADQLKREMRLFTALKRLYQTRITVVRVSSYDFVDQLLRPKKVHAITRTKPTTQRYIASVFWLTINENAVAVSRDSRS
jgi:hypothetical protein